MSEAEDASILGSNLTAVEAISAKLAEVTRLAEKLDAKLCKAGARTRPVSIPTAVTSSSSSLLSISAVSSSSTPTRTIFTATAPAPGVIATTASVIAPMHPVPSETASTTISVDKSIISTVDKPDESPLHIHSHSMEDIEKLNKDASTKELTENTRSESAAEEYNVENYTTATECSTTPPLRSRSESFVTMPECEDFSIATPVTSPCSDSAWWATEAPKPTVTTAPHISAPSNENPMLKFAETTPSAISTVNEIKPTTQIERMDKITDERSGRIVKEVTETTVLRVSHDIRLGVASYKCISNTVQDHRQHTDVKDIQNVERVLLEESHDKNGVHHDFGLSVSKESEKCIDKSPKTVLPDQNVTVKLTQIREHELNGSLHSDLKEYEDVLLSQDFLRRHEDSGIEMSPIKKDDNLEGEDFLERARKL